MIRGGFGRVYDRAGMQLISTFDANAPGGLGATVQNPCCTPGHTDAADVPRVDHGLPESISVVSPGFSNTVHPFCT